MLIGIARIVLFHDRVLTGVDLLFRVLALRWDLNKSCSSSYVEQTLFNGQELNQCLDQLNRAHKNQQNAVLESQNLAKSRMTEFSCFYFHVLVFGEFQFANHVDFGQTPLIKIVVLTQHYNKEKLVDRIIKWFGR